MALYSETKPHGGKLVNRLISAEEAASWVARAAELPQLRLDFRQWSDLYLIGEGAFSPIEGFQGSDEVSSVARDFRLRSGLLWSIPILLLAGDEAKQWKEGAAILLLDPQSAPVGVLHLEEIFRVAKSQLAEQVFRTTEEKHPGVAWLYGAGDTALAGKVSVFPGWKPHPYNGYASVPRETRRVIQERGWKRVAGFQTRNPIHRAHEYVLKVTLELTDGLLIHPLVGETKSDDIPADVRLQCYEALVARYFVPERVLLALYPTWMRYAGPREAIFHALVRKNYGCTHFIVGRDHAGVGNYYGPFEAQEIFQQFSQQDLGIRPLFFDAVFYCRVCGGMASLKTCAHGPETRVELSGTQVRTMLQKGELPPPEFSRKEVAQILVASMATVPTAIASDNGA
ncbi:MAG: sulfate adenylyltransferase [Acidobacteria bacterium]|nr:sulfate adenylyltransferase [Acidobacteriota bacterium]